MSEYIKRGQPLKQQKRDRTEVIVIPLTIRHERMDLTLPAEITADELELEFQYIIDQVRLIERGDH